MKWLLLFLTSLAMPSCTSSTKSEQALRSIYVGKNVDAFFVRHGPPVSSYRLNSGGMLYLWEKHGGTVALPGGSFQITDMTINSHGSMASNGSSVMRTVSGTQMSIGASDYNVSGHTHGRAITTSTPNRVLHAHCQFQIVTDARGTVQDVKCVKDSIGDWTTSWAHEYFDEERKMAGNVATAPAIGRRADHARPAKIEPARSSGGTLYL